MGRVKVVVAVVAGVLLLAAVAGATQLLVEQQRMRTAVNDLEGFMFDLEAEAAELRTTTAEAEASRDEAADELAETQAALERSEEALAESEERLAELEAAVEAAEAEAEAVQAETAAPSPSPWSSSGAPDVAVYDEDGNVIDHIHYDEISAFMDRHSPNVMCEAVDPLNPHSPVECWFWPADTFDH